MTPEVIESAATAIKSSSNPPPEIRNDEWRRESLLRSRAQQSQQRHQWSDRNIFVIHQLPS
jgi:hypothetical protein